MGTGVGPGFDERLLKLTLAPALLEQTACRVVPGRATGQLIQGRLELRIAGSRGWRLDHKLAQLLPDLATFLRWQPSELLHDLFSGQCHQCQITARLRRGNANPGDTQVRATGPRGATRALSQPSAFALRATADQRFTVPATGQAHRCRALRGGSWNNNRENARCAYRNDNNPDNRNDSIGFRVVSSPSGSDSGL